MTTEKKTEKASMEKYSPLIDSYFRRINYLRISLTQRCNHACFFCHHEGEIGIGREMDAEKIEALVRIANQRGVNRIKLTGGEALLREDILDIVRRLAPLTDDLSITTNGSKLEELAPRLKSNGLDRVNVSLHSLSSDVHKSITGRNNLDSIKRGIKTAIRVGLQPVKINMVILRNFNIDEIPDMMKYASDIGAILQLIELQSVFFPEQWEQYHVDLSDIEKDLGRKAIDVTQRSLHGRKIFTMPVADSTVMVEVVRPNQNHSFCQRCTRLRVTSDGKLKPCLLRQDNLVDIYSHSRDRPLAEIVNESLDRAANLHEPYWKDED